MAVTVGDQLGDFEIVRVLGEGGMGIVYLAEDRRLGRQVALKVISPRLAHDPEFQRRFETEARSAAAIEHPNAVTVYSAGQLEGELYMAMRYIDGIDLRHVLAQRGTLDPPVAAAILTDVASALDAAHAAGLVHRDVKPGNVLLTGDPGRGSAYLTDFGLTRGSQQLTGTGQWIGTLDYVAPEQMASEPIDARTDIYALGCVLYEMLAGAVPFAGSDLQKIFAKANQAIPQLPHGPEEFDSVIARATQRDPGRRYRSAGDLSRAATAALTGEVPELTERGVATGAAAAGLVESVPAESAGRHVSDLLPRRSPASDPPTKRLPTEQTARRPAEPHDRGGFSGRIAAIIGGSVVLAAGLIAGALIVAGNGGGNSRTVVDRGITTVGEPAKTKSTAEGSARVEEGSAASASAASPQEFSTGAYSVSIPAGWTQQESEKVARDGSYVENIWASPGGDEEILIDESAGEPAPPAESAEAIRTDLEAAEEPIYSARDGVFKGGASGSEIDFRASSGLQERADFFFDRGGSGFAVLASAEDQATARSLIGPTVSSLETTG